ncbi:MAG TPA: phenylalanine--tRNA ligase subunit beta [Candidatus Saccharimonadales bacterium]|nr:phenylalanine--tRNA ligase subunit beta [Candidatus Saccharimonadales bacterium]
MRVPLSWLREYVDVQLTPEQLAERLTLLGMEVRSVESWGADWQGVVVGELLSVERHPGADRLSLTRVTVGSGEPLDIVCGATNIAVGQRIPVALPGSVLPGDRRIERTEKMGVVSNGMLCSGDELRLTADGDGILILPSETPLGAQLVDLFGDVVLDVDVKPNRGDALSLIGLAREVSAVTGAPVRFPETDPTEADDDRVTDHLRVDAEEPELCPRFVGRWVSGVTVGPAPDRVQMRLISAGQRPVSNVVDVSNYVMLELGKPIHTFDAAVVHDGRIVVRRARAGERLETLDHVERELDEETLVIADPEGPLAIAGIMGGASSEISDTTTDVVVESAIFDPVNIRRSAFRYALRSEASLRFEKGQEHRLARLGADRAAKLIVDWAGGRVAAGAVDTDPVEPPPRRVAFRPRRVNRLLGTELSTEEQVALLARVGIATEPAQGGERITVASGPKPLEVDAGDAETLIATIPTWRRDLAIEADVTEEVARVRGYDVVPELLPHTPMPSFRHSPLRLRDTVRETLAGAGSTEAVTAALVSPAMVERFGPLEDPAVPGEGEASGRPVTVTNPLSSQHSVMRQSLIGSLLEVVSTNVRQGRADVAVFEVGKGYGATEDGGTHEWWRLGLAMTGAAEIPAWNRPARPIDLDDAKGVIELLARRLGFGPPAYSAVTDDPNLHPGRTARVAIDGALSGRVGEVHPSLADSLELRGGRVYVAELAIAGLSGGQPSVPRVVTPSRHPVAERDLAVIVQADVTAAAIEAAIRAHGGGLLRAVTLFDIYRGRPLSDDEKSLAYRLAFQAEDRTLTETEVDAAVAAVTSGLATDVGGRLRT